MRCAANRMFLSSHNFQFSFFCSGRYRVRVPMTAEGIMHQLWNQAFLNVYLSSLLLHLLKCSNFMVVTIKYIFNKCNRKFVKILFQEKIKDTMYCNSILQLHWKSFKPFVWDCKDQLWKSMLKVNETTEVLWGLVLSSYCYSRPKNGKIPKTMHVFTRDNHFNC